jgi:stage IV sporulation protein FB
MALFHGFIYDVLLLFIIVLIHEIGHASVALSYGWRVKKIEILPFGGVAEVEEHGNRPIHEEALVIAAGPFMNVIMIGFAYLCLSLGIWKEAFTYQFLEYNLIILLFNLLPIWPLDGGKFVQLLLSLLFPFKKAIRHSLLVSGGCLSLYFIIVGFFFPYYFYLWIVGGFFIIAGWLEIKQSHFQYIRFLMERHNTNRIEERFPDVVSVMVMPNYLLKDAIYKMFRHKFHYFCILTPRGEVKHVVDEQEMLDHYFGNQHVHCTVGDVFG